ncbi:UDP-N-acetylglucosamine 2-epimerase (non-hydrolyzing) [Candidatus Woesearchaeota archaeon]|nr:UDP-N-acetylglucosamine 2-epimerase (non-hydrolyzing) [Candidatus Woesearchaeota archaeon]
MKVATILGTRPEMVKLSSLMPLLEQEPETQHIVIHTGQHYDYSMDKVFFEELKLKEPNYKLNIGSHSQGKQTGLMLEKIEEIMIKEKPDLVLVQGDTNSTLAGALTAAKLQIKIMHIEAGCRSFNRAMPEEVNRVVADHIADYLVAPDKNSYNNLIAEGIDKERIYLLGSTSFDAVKRNEKLVDKENALDKLLVTKDNFVLVTIHRAENTNNIIVLKQILSALNQLAEKINFVFPMHPRTKKIIEDNKLQINKSIKVIEPQPYLSFLALLSSCRFCLTDSGGIQEEALAFNVPCLICREETEWMRLVEAGKNILVGTQTEKIVAEINKLLSDEELQKIKRIDYGFDLDVSNKIIEIIKNVGVIK